MKYARAFLLWLSFLAVAIAGALIREKLLVPALGPLAGKALGTLLTIAFECLFGHYVMGLSWQSIWADYNVFQGRLWPLVLIVTLFGPLLAGKIRDYIHVRPPS